MTLLGMETAPAFVGQYVLSQLLTYPLMTVQRRIECHSPRVVTMLDVPYSSTHG